MGEYIALLGQLVVVLIPMGVVLIFVTLLFTEFYIKKTVRGATLMVFWNPNRVMVFELVRTEGKRTVFVGDGTYTLHAERQFSVGYPFWAPAWMQEQVPVYYFNPESYESIDPTLQSDEQLMTAAMLRDITDEAMLKATIKEAREAAEGTFNKRNTMGIYILVAIGVVAIALGVDIYLQYQTYDMAIRLSEAVLSNGG